ncbi:MAG: hypothetical protein QOH71_4326 [Blastocatellia bacterium]|jgi:hypothetical protein|nr:hypothetical protein [Blastocatellia bacterium]
MKPTITLAILFLLCCCFVAAAQIPQKKDDLSISEREEWRKILKWPDACEAGYQAYKQYSPPGGLFFNKLGSREYLVSVGCAANEWLFMYYRETNSIVTRLLRFAEYDAAHHTAASAYSRVHSLTYGFDEHRDLWIYSQASDNVCLMHRYRFRHGQPTFVASRKVPCADVVNTSRAP